MTIWSPAALLLFGFRCVALLYSNNSMQPVSRSKDAEEQRRCAAVSLRSLREIKSCIANKAYKRVIRQSRRGTTGGDSRTELITKRNMNEKEQASQFFLERNVLSKIFYNNYKG